jgi:hypothetical protein
MMVLTILKPLPLELSPWSTTPENFTDYTNILKPPQNGRITMRVPCKYLTPMVIAEDGTNNFEASTFGTVSMEYKRVLQNTPIFSNLHKLG